MINLLFLLAFAAQSSGLPAYERANSLFAQKKLTEALAAVNKALQADPRLIPALTLKAKLAMAAKRYAVARITLEHALSIDPAAAYPQFLYGLQFYFANELQLALPQFRRARQLNPSDARSAQYLGLTLESLGHAADALKEYEDAAKLNPNDVEILLTGARLLCSEDRLPECRLWIGKAVAANPRSRDAHFERARLLLRMGDAPAAAEEGELALSLPPGDAADSQIHYLLVRAYRMDNPAAAARHAETLRIAEQPPGP